MTEKEVQKSLKASEALNEHLFKMRANLKDHQRFIDKMTEALKGEFNDKDVTAVDACSFQELISFAGSVSQEPQASYIMQNLDSWIEEKRIGWQTVKFIWKGEE